mgnify:CR=1 FL=1|jgi:hypothetical protein
MDQFVQKSLLTLNLEPNRTNTQYFSSNNIGLIQKHLILETKKYTGYVISEQNCISVLTAMQYFYVNYPQFTQDTDVEQNVLSLNSLVVNDLVQQTVSGVKQHMDYLKYIQKAPEPLEYGKSTNVKGQNSLQFNSTGI